MNLIEMLLKLILPRRLLLRTHAFVRKQLLTSSLFIGVILRSNFLTHLIGLPKLLSIILLQVISRPMNSAAIISSSKSYLLGLTLKNSSLSFLQKYALNGPLDFGLLSLFRYLKF